MDSTDPTAVGTTSGGSAQVQGSGSAEEPLVEGSAQVALEGSTIEMSREPQDVLLAKSRALL